MKSAQILLAIVFGMVLASTAWGQYEQSGTMSMKEMRGAITAVENLEKLGVLDEMGDAEQCALAILVCSSPQPVDNLCQYRCKVLPGGGAGTVLAECGSPIKLCLGLPNCNAICVP